MTLTKYIEVNKLDRRELADLLKVDPITLYRWETGRRFPRNHIHEIMRITQNRVTANDFIGVAA